MSETRRRFDRAAGIALLLVGIAVAVVAVIALRQPHGHTEAAAKQSIATDSAGNAISTDAAASPTSSASASASSEPTATTTATASASASASESAGVKSVPLVVLNATKRTGLGSTARGRFVAGGWTVTSVGNLVDNILSTCAYYDPSDPANKVAATALAQQFPAIVRVKEKYSGLPAGPIVVVLAADYS